MVLSRAIAVRVLPTSTSSFKDRYSYGDDLLLDVGGSSGFVHLAAHKVNTMGIDDVPLLERSESYSARNLCAHIGINTTGRALLFPIRRPSIDRRPNS
jgi:hypothetical protein